MILRKIEEVETQDVSQWLFDMSLTRFQSELSSPSVPRQDYSKLLPFEAQTLLLLENWK